MAINYIYTHLTVQSSHQHITLSTMHKKRWHVSVISFPNYFKLCDILSFFSCIFLLFFFSAYNSHNFYIFVVSGCRIWTLNHVNRHKSFTRELFRKFNLTNSNGFSVYTLCHSNYNNKKENILGILNWLPGIKKNCFREKLLFYVFCYSVKWLRELNLFYLIL